MEKRRNRNTDNEITKYIKYFIVETEDKSLKNQHAYARYRILKGAKDNEFMKKVSKRTNKNQSDIIKECSLYFVEREKNKASLRELDVDEYGRLKNWPESFFGDALGETREQARLMFSKQQEING